MEKTRRSIPIEVPRGSVVHFGRGKGGKGRRQAPTLASTTLWNYPSHHYGSGFQGDQQYVGATPAFILWNLMQRYTRRGDAVVDPFCGSGTTLDVAAELERRAVGFDVAPYRPGIHRADARDLPLDDAVADLVFIDPPYADNVKYSNDKACLGRFRAGDPRYYEGLAKALDECHRILKPGGTFACYVCDHFATKTGFEPIGFKLFTLIQERFLPLDVVAVVRHNKNLKEPRWHRGARRGGFLLRGFSYLFIARKTGAEATVQGKGRSAGPSEFGGKRPPRPKGTAGAVAKASFRHRGDGKPGAKGPGAPRGAGKPGAKGPGDPRGEGKPDEKGPGRPRGAGKPDGKGPKRPRGAGGPGGKGPARFAKKPRGKGKGPGGRGGAKKLSPRDAPKD